MALDGLFLRAVVNELQHCIGGRIGKIHQPTASDIVLNIRSRGNNVKLLISANPSYPRIHLTSRSFVNPPEAPMFCMLLRKHCENGIIESIEQAGLERIIMIRIKKQDEIGDTGSKSLIIELMGRHSNIIMIDPGSQTIVDSIHHVTPAISSYRTVLPGFAYVAPPEQGKLNPLQATEQDFAKATQGTITELSEKDGHTESTDKLIVRRFSGISPLIASEIAYRSQHAIDERTAPLTLWHAFAGIIEQVRQHQYSPNIVKVEGKEYFSIVRLAHLQGSHIDLADASECLETYYGDKAERDTVKQKTADMLKFLHNEKIKNVKKLEKLEETVMEARDADRYRIIGELLTASLHLLQKGDKEAEVVNYYDEEQRMLKVSLDPLLTPSENVQRYFKKYTKGKNSVVAVQEQLKNTREEIVYLDSVLQQLSSADMEDIEEIREELISQGYIRDRNKKERKQKKKGQPRPAMFMSSEGIPIYVGKNNIQNEYVTNRLARSNDTWLHTKDIPGSHVVIRSDSYGQQTLAEAAQLAAYFSQARASSSVPVDYTLIRHVRKPSGAKPGFVIYDHQKTLFVTPDEQLVSKWAADTEK